MSIIRKIFDTTNYPLDGWFKYANSLNTHTPDLAKLERSQFQLLFVPDELQRRHSNYKIIEEYSAFVGAAFTMHQYQFWQKNAGPESFPIPMETDGKETIVRYLPPSCKIKGELHAVESSRFLELDKYRENTVQFNRKRVRLLIPYRGVLGEEWRSVNGKPLPKVLLGKKGTLTPERMHIVKAWMYIGNPDYWNDLLDAGYSFSPVQTFEPNKYRQWLTRYYEYPK